MKIDKFDDRYNYYFYGVNGICDINEGFFYGLMMDENHGLNMQVTANVIMYGLEEYVREYARKYNYNKVFVIKIPSYYLGWVHRNGKIEPFVPILLSKENEGNNEKTIITSNLVYGVYDNNYSVYLSNDRYNPLYDPSGMKYVDSQLRAMYKFGCYDLYVQELRRNGFSFEELLSADNECNRWDRVLKHYNGNKIKKVLKKIFK